MGQGIHTTLAALVAEEPDVAWDSIRVEHGAPGAAHYNHAAIAERLGMPADQLKTTCGRVIAPDGRRLAYVELAGAAAQVRLPENLPLKSRAQWRYLGKNMPRVDSLGKCTGTAEFGIDVRQPDMVFATVSMNPALGRRCAASMPHQR